MLVRQEGAITLPRLEVGRDDGEVFVVAVVERPCAVCRDGKHGEVVQSDVDARGELGEANSVSGT